MENNCLHCGKKVKNKYCNVSCQNRHQKKGVKIKKESIEKRCQTELKKWKEFEVTCHECNTPFTIKEYDVEKPKKEKYFCCRSCSNVRVWTEEKRKKLSETAKNSEKVKRANKIIAENNKGFKTINGVKITAMTMIDTPCSYCGEPITHKENVVRTHHSKCWLKCSGGFRENSTKKYSSYYKGYKMDSNSEKEFAILCDKENIKWIKNNGEYFFEYLGTDLKNHKYYPDFYLEEFDYWVEIKGKLYADKDGNLKNKLSSVKNIFLLYSKEIKKFNFDELK